MVFATADWAERATRALDRYALVHLYDERHNLPADAPLDHLESRTASQPMQSVVHRMATGEAVAEEFLVAGDPLTRRSTCGLAWASRRELLEEHGLYDACILFILNQAVDERRALGWFDRRRAGSEHDSPRD